MSTLSEVESKALMGRHGVPVLAERLVATPEEAAEAAEELGVSTTQLMTDLNQLWVCGLPGYGPGDLIDLSFSEESIEVTFSAGIDRPLRLTSTEATACSAYPPDRPVNAHTRRPAHEASTPSPTAVTLPATSLPRRWPSRKP